MKSAGRDDCGAIHRTCGSKSRAIEIAAAVLLAIVLGAALQCLAEEPDFELRLREAPEKEKAALLNSRAYELRNSDHSESFRKAARALLWAEKSGDQKQRGWALALLGLSNCFQGNLDKAEANLTQALEILRRGKYRENELHVLNWLGVTFYQKGDYQRALFYYEEARKRASADRGFRIESDTLSSIAIILNRRGQFQKAMEYYLAALKI